LKIKEMFKLYTNIKKYAKCCGHKIQGDLLGETEFSNNFRLLGYVSVKMKCNRCHPNGNVSIDTIKYVVVCNRKIVAKKNDLNKIFNSIPEHGRAKVNLEILLVVPHPIATTATKNILEKNNWEGNAYVNVQYIYHNQFIFNPNNHIKSAKMTRLTVEKKALILKQTFTIPSDWPIINYGSPTSIWLGCYPGDMVECKYNSPICGYQTNYMMVKEKTPN
jgi:DNA-directed RNA polymerase subunit H (RpoH/RPB5)